MSGLCKRLDFTLLLLAQVDIRLGSLSSRREMFDYGSAFDRNDLEYTSIYTFAISEVVSKNCLNDWINRIAENASSRDSYGHWFK